MRTKWVFFICASSRSVSTYKTYRTVVAVATAVRFVKPWPFFAELLCQAATNDGKKKEKKQFHRMFFFGTGRKMSRPGYYFFYRCCTLPWFSRVNIELWFLVKSKKRRTYVDTSILYLRNCYKERKRRQRGFSSSLLLPHGNYTYARRLKIEAGSELFSIHWKNLDWIQFDRLCLEGIICWTDWLHARSTYAWELQSLI